MTDMLIKLWVRGQSEPAAGQQIHDIKWRSSRCATWHPAGWLDHSCRSSACVDIASRVSLRQPGRRPVGPCTTEVCCRCPASQHRLQQACFGFRAALCSSAHAFVLTKRMPRLNPPLSADVSADVAGTPAPGARCCRQQTPDCAPGERSTSGGLDCLCERVRLALRLSAVDCSSEAFAVGSLAAICQFLVSMELRKHCISVCAKLLTTNGTGESCSYGGCSQAALQLDQNQVAILVAARHELLCTLRRSSARRSAALRALHTQPPNAASEPESICDIAQVLIQA